MAQKTAPLLPDTERHLHRFGDRLRLARLRRKLPAKQVADRSGMSPMTLRSLERGGSGVTIGAYLAVMQVLGIEKDLNMLAMADPLGRELQDARLKTRAPKAPSAAAAVTWREPSAPPEVPVKPPRRGSKPMKPAEDWVAKGGFSSADALTGLLATKPSATKKPR